MRTYLTNCILTFDGAPRGQSQAFLDLLVPLEAGEEVCRIFFEGIGDTVHLRTLKPGFTPNTNSATNKRAVRLVKVSMCADDGGEPTSFAQNPLLYWFTKGNGKLYFPES